MNIIQLQLLITQATMETQAEKTEFNTAAIHRVESLQRAIKAGEYYYQVKQLVLNAPNKGLVTTDLGTFKGWKDCLKQLGLDYCSIEQYIFMYKHQQEFYEMKLLSTAQDDIDSGASGHRKIAACEAVKWYLKLLKQDPFIRGKVTAADYQAQKSQLAAVGNQTLAQPSMIKIKYDVYQSMVNELEELRAEVAKYRLTVSHLFNSF